MTTNAKPLTGVQKVEALERSLANMAQRHDQQMQIVADEINHLNNTVVALAKRLNAIVKAGESDTGVNTDSVQKVMQTEAAKELKAKVSQFEEQGVIKRNDLKEIDDDTFVVAREEDSEGKEINPRTQFLVKALHPEAKALILGKKVGDQIVNDELKQVMFITETYDLVQPKVQEEDAAIEAPSESDSQPQQQAAGAEVIRTKPKKSKKA
jgi:hypothetical protein